MIIGSPNSQIQLVNYWPDITLDEYINLKERVENRMVITDITATGDDNTATSTDDTATGTDNTATGSDNTATGTGTDDSDT